MPRATPSSTGPCQESSPSGQPTTSSSTATSPMPTASGTVGHRSERLQRAVRGLLPVQRRRHQRHPRPHRQQLRRGEPTDVAASTQGNNATVLEPACGAHPAPTCDPSNGDQRHHHRRRRARPDPVVRREQLRPTATPRVNSDRLRLDPAIRPWADRRRSAATPITSGYQKHYTWDPLLDFVSPPSYLVPSTPSWVLRVASTTNAGVGSTSICPPLQGLFSGIREGGAARRTRRDPVLLGFCLAGSPTTRPCTAPSAPNIGTRDSNRQRNRDGELDGSGVERWLEHHGLHRGAEPTLPDLQYTSPGRWQRHVQHDDHAE